MNNRAKHSPVAKAILTVFVTALALIFVVHLIRAHAQTNKHDAALAYKLADGPYATETIDQTLHDAKRNKDLPIRIVVPKSGGPFPVIVFSHGAGGSGQNYFGLTGFWASHGYVVIQPTHNDSVALRREQGEPLPSGPRELVEEYLFNYQDWIDRVRDVTLVMDSLVELEKRLPELKGKLDQKRIGVGGHSYGAFTTQMIGGVTLDIPGQPKAQSFGDARPLALLLLSPQGKSANGLTENSWKTMTRPMMTMSGSNDSGVMGQLANWRRDPFTYSPAGDKYLVWIEGAFHMSFTGALAQPQTASGPRGMLFSRMGQGTDQKAVFDYVKVASIAFWDAYLKGEPKAKTYLTSDTLVKYSNQTVSVDRK
jgi:predicted dienelactone hydrolase